MTRPAGVRHPCGPAGMQTGNAFYYQSSPNLSGFGGLSALSLHSSGIFGTDFGNSVVRTSYYDLAAASRAMQMPRRQRKPRFYPEPGITRCDSEKEREEKLHNYLSYMTTSGRYSHLPAVAATDRASMFTRPMQLSRPFVPDLSVTWNDVVYHVTKATAASPILDEYDVQRADAQRTSLSFPLGTESVSSERLSPEQRSVTEELRQAFARFKKHDFDSAAAILKAAVNSRSEGDMPLADVNDLNLNHVSPAWDWLMENPGSYDRIHLIALWQKLAGSPDRAVRLMAAATHDDVSLADNSRLIIALIGYAGIDTGSN